MSLLGQENYELSGKVITLSSDQLPNVTNSLLFLKSSHALIISSFLLTPCSISLLACNLSWQYGYVVLPI